MLSEILSLAKAGYKKKDIDEILKMEDSKKTEENLQDSKDTSVGAPINDGNDTKDFEALYTEALKKLSEVEEKLKIAQSENRSKGTLKTSTIEDEFKKLSGLLNG